MKFLHKDFFLLDYILWNRTFNEPTKNLGFLLEKYLLLKEDNFLHEEVDFCKNSLQEHKEI